MYAKGDPRASLNTAATASPAATAYKGAAYARFYEEEPQEQDATGRTWYARGQNLVIAYSEAGTGMVLETETIDEYAVLVPFQGTAVTIEAAGGTETVNGPGVAFVPAGTSRIEVTSGGVVVRMITTLNTATAALCSNAAHYDTSDPNVAPFQPWPAPEGPARIRAYDADVPDEEGRFGRLFRGQNVMINFFKLSPPRDTTRMSPHHHPDFEQYSLCLKGAYIHYLRWPWTTDMAAWRPDDAEECKAPSVAVIPPPAIHTSRSMDPDGNLLIDIFGPPRADFSAKPGWVLNADEYPMPDADGRASERTKT